MIVSDGLTHLRDSKLYVSYIHHKNAFLKGATYLK